MNPIRIGKISYTNVLPIYHYFDTQGLNVELIHQVPAKCNHDLANGTIDLASISSFAYGQNWKDYYLMPDLCVSSHGPVRSIFLFTKGKKMSELDGCKIALTSSSASSVHLLRILLEKFEGVIPSYITMEPDLERMMEEADAALLIGDDAIQASWRNHGYKVMDLGEEWYKHTGLSMVYAVWAVRREVVETRKEEMTKIYQRFMESKQRAKQDILPVIMAAQQRLGGSRNYWETYFRGLSHDFGDRERKGLETYYRYAGELGFLPKDLQME